MTTTPKGRWFRFTLRTLIVVVTVLAGCVAKQPAPDDKPHSATILREVIAEDKSANWKVIGIENPEELAKLESFFPNYRGHPTLVDPGGWMTGYIIYFNFAGGKAVRVDVSSDGNGADAWVLGGSRGDSEVRGNLKAFVDDIEIKRYGRQP